MTDAEYQNEPADKIDTVLALSDMEAEMEKEAMERAKNAR